MSELIQQNDNRATIRWKLLTGASAIVLIACASSSALAQGEDADRPALWIELGGQLETLRNTQDQFTAPFLYGPQPLEPFPFAHRFALAPLVAETAPQAPFDYSRPLAAQKPPEQSVGGEAKLVFTPHGSDWVFSASIRYGRSNGNGNAHQTTGDRIHTASRLGFHITRFATPNIVRFSDAEAKYNESHSILDFQAGHDVGLGIFGNNSSSVINAGVRFAQFTTRSNTTVKADPDIQAYGYKKYGTSGPKYFMGTRFHTYALSGHSVRTFHGVGPSLSWSGSAPFAGNPETAEFTIDWGVNAAVLFGKQRARVSHATADYDRIHTPNYLYDARHTQYNNPTSHTRSRSVTVPNLGAFAGLSLKFPNANVSLGYRADFFFGAMDAGIDVRHTRDMTFNGPYASISIGLGD